MNIAELLHILKEDLETAPLICVRLIQFLQRLHLICLIVILLLHKFLNHLKSAAGRFRLTKHN